MVVRQAYTRCSGLARPRAPALQCLDVLLGAGELPRRLVFGCVCAGMVPVAWVLCWSAPAALVARGVV